MTRPAQQEAHVSLTPEHQQHVLQTACATILSTITGTPSETNLDDDVANQTVWGAFVTLKREGHLRACCGVLGQPMPISEAVIRAAQRTAIEDSRLPPISVTELPFQDVDVSLLHSATAMTAQGRDRIDQVEIGRHGLTIQRGQNSGLLLPTVAADMNWDAESFLRHVCSKAGLPTTAWMDQDAEIRTFEANVSEAVFGEVIQDYPELNSFPPDPELSQLAQHCRNNIALLQQGATPSYYLTGCSDGTVQGIVLTILNGEGQEPLHLFQYAMRPGMPLQSTLLTMCQSAAQNIQLSPDFQVGVCVLTDSAMHGTLAAPDLRGFDSDRRGLLLVDQGQAAFAFHQGGDPEAILEDVRDRLQALTPQTASLYSFRAKSLFNEVSICTVPRADGGAEVRQPAVAGTFYPADAAELEQTVESLWPDGPRDPQFWDAVMLPHAGLAYSGRVAAATLHRVEVPSKVIVIGPKHTRLGLQWAVAPHQMWRIPGKQIAADPELADALSQAIPGLKRDAAAHRKEHAIEVELPLIAALSPETQVVGIAIGGGNLETMEEFATGLASVIEKMSSPPLLVISSDMNHFATDAENRRLDRIALDALKTLDPAKLFHTVREHQISMCGMLPAVAVLETLRKLDRLRRYEEVAYATSADVSGDKRRVVGYAGALIGS